MRYLSEKNTLAGRRLVQELMHSAFASTTLAATCELYHYGVKGQKWGVRRTPEQLGRSTKSIATSSKSDKIRHATLEKKLASYGPRQIDKSIRSFEKQIARHQDYLRNPEKHVPDWKTLTDKRRKNHIEHWNTEIRNFKEQREITLKVKKGE